MADWLCSGLIISSYRGITALIVLDLPAPHSLLRHQLFYLYLLVTGLWYMGFKGNQIIYMT